MSKTAFLFLTIKNHNCQGLWDLFFQGIPNSLYSIYCHPKFTPTQPLLKDNIVSRTIPTQWGDISLVRASLILLREAYTDPKNEYFILLSDSCIPIIDFTFMREKLYDKSTRGYSYIHYKHIANRLDRYQKLSPYIRQKIKWGDFYSQHQWMILHRKHVRMCLALVPRLLSHFNNVHAVDEHFFVTIFQLLGVLKKEFINQKTTYCDWGDTKAMHPKTFTTLSNQLVYQMQTTGHFFARKISDKTKISNYLLNCLTDFRKDKISG